MARLLPGREHRAGLFAVLSLSRLGQKKEKRDELSIKKWALLWELERGVWRSQWRTPVIVVVILWFSEASELEIYWKTEDSPSETLFKRYGIARGDDDRFRGVIWRSLGHTSSSFLFCKFVFGRGTVLAGLVWIFWRQISFCLSFWISDQCWIEHYCLKTCLSNRRSLEPFLRSIWNRFS